ncbi:hypothetical protein Tco_0321559 [Tanacetum coccineum]
MKASLQGKDNAIKKLKEKISQMNERRSEADRILDFKALDIQNIELTEKVTALQEQNAHFRAENEKFKQHYKELYDSIKIRVLKLLKRQLLLLAPGIYAIDVEPIPPRNRNNREVHVDYLKHLKESIETLCEIVEEAKIEKPLDNALGNACFYTKRSQELLEYVTGTCPKEFNKRDKKPQKDQKTNAPMIPSTGVISSTEASGSKPRRNTKNTRILQARSDNKKKVEDHPRNNKSNLKQKNRVDSSISSKRTWKPTGRKFTLGEQCPLTRFTKSKVVPVKQTERVRSNTIVITKKFNNNSQKPLTRYIRKIKQEKAIPSSIPTTAETQTIDASVKYTAVYANQTDPNII